MPAQLQNKILFILAHEYARLTRLKSSNERRTISASQARTTQSDLDVIIKEQLHNGISQFGDPEAGLDFANQLARIGVHASFPQQLRDEFGVRGSQAELEKIVPQLAITALATESDRLV